MLNCDNWLLLVPMDDVSIADTISLQVPDEYGLLNISNHWFNSNYWFNFAREI